MTQEHQNIAEMKNRDGEKGAALISVLLISLLLLVACIGLLVESSMNTANVSDATAEQQAYNAAESGIQSVLNVLRGNVVPNPLIAPSKSPTAVENRIDFLKALQLNSSNLDTDSSTVPRLSRWMNYNYTPVGSSNPDRITMGAGTYDPFSGFAYSVSVSDPDNTGSRIAYNTSGSIDGSGSSKTFGSLPNTVTISYVSKSVSSLDVSSGIASTDFGRFVISILGTGASIPDDVRFEINLNMTTPYSATRVIRGFIKAGTITNNSVGS
ncbi:MAG: hypothetical protein KDB79_11760, partial [Acidobacteria bacterium]|nr:hypothetical protein [Acidobacteriota bacterium]